MCFCFAAGYGSVRVGDRYIDEALVLAGDNRGELKRMLATMRATRCHNRFLDSANSTSGDLFSDITLANFEASAIEYGIKNFAEFISHYKYFCNFVFGEHIDKSICL